MVMGSLNQEVEAVVIGSGPGGYVAALRLADLGKDVLLVEERERPGGTCLNTAISGCCTSASQCGDSNPCTADTCVSNACVHTPISSCCTSAAH